MNLYEETMSAMNRHGKTEYDVFFCECYQMGRNRNLPIQFPFSVFKKNSHFDYNECSGSVKVNNSLKIVFFDGSWLEREYYDGAEWWAFRQLPVFISLMKDETIDLSMEYYK